MKAVAPQAILTMMNKSQVKKELLNIENSSILAEEKQALPEKLQWKVLPMAKSWKKTTFLLLFMIFLWVVVQIGYQDWTLTIMSVLLLTGSLSPHFTFTRYEMNNENILVKRPLYKIVKPWSYFHRYFVDMEGVTLSPFVSSNRLEPFRSLRLRFNDNRQEVLDYIEKMLPSDKEDKIE